MVANFKTFTCLSSIFIIILILNSGIQESSAFVTHLDARDGRGNAINNSPNPNYELIKMILQKIDWKTYLKREYPVIFSRLFRCLKDFFLTTDYKKYINPTLEGSSTDEPHPMIVMIKTLYRKITVFDQEQETVAQEN